VAETMSLLEIDDNGLDNMDRKILNALIKNYNGGPAGINAIASSLGIEPETISEVYEPFLLQSGYVIRTHRGRVATEKSYEVLGLKSPIKNENSLWEGENEIWIFEK